MKDGREGGMKQGEERRGEERGRKTKMGGEEG